MASFEIEVFGKTYTFNNVAEIDAGHYVTVGEYAAGAGVSEVTVRRWLRAGRIDGFKDGGVWYVSEYAPIPDETPWGRPRGPWSPGRSGNSGTPSKGRADLGHT